MVDPVGATLGGAEVFLGLFENCKSLYKACSRMRYFGADSRRQLQERELQAIFLKTLLDTKASDLRKEPDLDNPDHPVTQEIRKYLVIIETDFTECNRIVADALAHSKHLFVGDSRGPPSDAGYQSSIESVGRMHSILRRIKRRPKVKNSRSRSSSQSDNRDFRPFGVDGPTVPVPVPALTLAGGPVRPISPSDVESQEIQAQASLWTLVKWADHNKKDMEAALAKLRRSIKDLRGYLELREPTRAADLSRTLGVIVDDDHLRHHKHKFPPKILERVHNALERINRQPDTVCTFGIFIKDTSAVNRDKLKRSLGGDHLLRQESQVLFVQKREAGNRSRFLAIESVQSIDAGVAGHRAVADVSDLISPPLNPADASRGRHAVCGALQDNIADHHIFVERHDWEFFRSFREFFDDDAFRQSLERNTRAVVDITCMILTSYLDFEVLRGATRPPRLEDFLTFRAPTGYDDGQPVRNVADAKLWLAPYWSNGFGTPMDRPVLGEPDAEMEPDAAVVELALVLFQLCSGSKEVSERTSDGGEYTWRTAKAKALKSLTQVTQKHGLPLADVVNACLRADAENEKKVICSCLASLEEFKVELDRGKLSGFSDI